ncbi:MAG: cytochrome c4 [Negativicutes bacterium]|nr:cytochrome c4 [Negativicutes bacterium]
MNRSIPMALAIMYLGSSAAFAQQSASPAPTYMGTVKTCEGCHGSGGHSAGPSTPRLNGQKAEYIIARLQDFLDSTKEAPHASYMVHAVKNIPDSSKAEIAQYFSNQIPTEPNTTSQESSGQHIFESGYPADNIPACQSCHGSHGEGRGAVPRLAGQHAGYLRNQLWTFGLRLRQNNVMHANIMQMSSGQIDALVTYLANN